MTTYRALHGREIFMFATTGRLLARVIYHFALSRDAISVHAFLCARISQQELSSS